MRFIDTNVFIHYLTGQDPPKTEASLALMIDIEDGGQEATTCEAVIAEIVYVLRSK